MPTKHYPGIYLTPGSRVYSARLVVPHDVRAIIGRNAFAQSTGQTDPHQAYQVAAPLLREWRERIAQARTAGTDTTSREIERLAALVRGKVADTATLDHAIWTACSVVFEELGGLSAAARRASLEASGTDMAALLARMPGAATASVARVAGQTSTPFGKYLDAWEAASHLTGSSLKQTAREVREFFAAHPGLTAETLSGATVQRWIDGQRATSKPDTIRHRLNSCRAYWNWMQSHEHVPESAIPFNNRKIQDSRSAGAIAEGKRMRWTKADVKRLWAATEGDRDMHAAVMIASYTGARRAEICGLTVASVRTDADSGMRYFDITDSKTTAGLRMVPVHSAINGLVDQLIAEAGADGKLIDCQGDTLGKRFSDLKTELGYDARHVFHSFRKTVCYELGKAGVVLSTVKNIVGHEDSDITTGTYGGVAELATKAAALEKLSY